MAWDELPKGWELTSLAHIAQDVQTGFACSARDEEGLPHLRPNNVGTDGKIDLTLVKRVPFEAGDLSKYDLKPGDVLFNNTNSQELVGKTVIFGLEGTYSFSNHLTRIRVQPDLLIPEWLSFWFQHLWRTRYFERICNRWIGQAGINTEKLSGVEVPLLPLPEQRRIVARIEELTERIDAARHLRAEAAEEAAAILPTVLAEVFGEAEEKGWEVETLGGLSTHVRYGLTAKASPHVEGTLFIRITDIGEDGKLRLDEPHYVQIDDNTYERFRIEQDNILIARSGATAGKAHLCSPEGRAVFASYLIRFRLDKEKAFPRFLFYFLHSPTYWAQLNQWKIGGAQPNVNATNLKRIEVPLPPIAEQRRIVEYLDTVQAKVEAIRRYQAETREEIEAMTGAVLERAFRGEL